MKICIVSMKPKLGNKKKNIDKMEKFIKNEEAELYIFGEMALTGYACREEIFSLAEGIDGESIREMKEICEEKGVIFGMPIEERKGIIYNSAVFIKQDSIEIYNKNFLANFGPFEEKFYFSPGKDLPVFNFNGWKIGIAICYDIFFPELIKGMVLKGADLIVCISASPSTTRKQFESVLPARAIENTVFVAYSNLVGEENGLSFWGGSRIYKPNGEMINKTEYFKEESIICEIDKDELKEARIARPTLKDTTPDIFLELYNISRHKEVFNEYVKIGIEMGEKAKKEMKISEVDLYGNEDVAFGIKIATGCKVNLFNSKEIKAIFKGDKELEIKIDDL
ncbi:MAG: carbon-nitrogen hydrolase family protein [Candidatus Thermoplasmatota archaeon]